MGSLDKLFLKIAGMSRWARQKLAFDGQTESERRIAKLTLKLDYPGQKRESNGQFGTGKKAGGSSSGGSGTSKPMKVKKSISNKPKKPKLLPRERAALHHELNTHLTESERNDGIVTKNLFGAYYTVEINGFDEYNVLKVRRADETRKDYLDDFRKKGKKR